jgi:hypothetical protein
MAVDFLYVVLALSFALIAAAIGAITRWSILLFLSGTILFVAVAVPVDEIVYSRTSEFVVTNSTTGDGIWHTTEHKEVFEPTLRVLVALLGVVILIAAYVWYREN